MKQNKYKLTLAYSYFWRTIQQQEIDYVEKVNQKLYGYEFKWNTKKKATLSKTFIRTYNAEGKTINRENFREFVIVKK